MSSSAPAVARGPRAGARWRGVVVAVVLAVAGVLGAGAGQDGGAVYGGLSSYGAAADAAGPAAPGADQHLAGGPGAGPEDRAAPQHGHRGAAAERPTAPFAVAPRPPHEIPRPAARPAPDGSEGGPLPGFSPAPRTGRAPPAAPGS
ncbi:hypothetical protein [Streptomyces sp. MAR4 CNX-425]|uniref:hypothetical protein n=1 Tax=Streptomyces sp. MAR4 CNX-425 TaxID=3406343 RepID=UPI003B50130F